MVNKVQALRLNRKLRVKTSLATRFRTTFIYALDQIEKEFGELWGHGKSIEEMDEDELEWYQAYLQLRKNILDNGNTQSRSAWNEISQYELIGKNDKDVDNE